MAPTSDRVESAKVNGSACNPKARAGSLANHLTLARVAWPISRQLTEARLELFVSNDHEHSFHRFRFKQLFFTDKEVVFGDERNKIQAELPSGRLHAKTNVGNAAGNAGSNSSVCRLHLHVAVDAGTIESLLFQHPIEQYSRRATQCGRVCPGSRSKLPPPE